MLENAELDNRYKKQVSINSSEQVGSLIRDHPIPNNTKPILERVHHYTFSWLLIQNRQYMEMRESCKSYFLLDLFACYIHVDG